MKVKIFSHEDWQVYQICCRNQRALSRTHCLYAIDFLFGRQQVSMKITLQWISTRQQERQINNVAGMNFIDQHLNRNIRMHLKPWPLSAHKESVWGAYLINKGHRNEALITTSGQLQNPTVPLRELCGSRGLDSCRPTGPCSSVCSLDMSIIRFAFPNSILRSEINSFRLIFQSLEMASETHFMFSWLVMYHEIEWKLKLSVRPYIDRWGGH